MKPIKSLLLPSIALLIVMLSAGCQKETLNSSPANPTAYRMTASPGSLSAFKQQPQLRAVDLGLAGNFVILSKSGITNVYKSTITGDIGSSPITGAAILVTCAEVTGTIYSVDAAGPLPCAVNNATRLTLAVGDMQTAYTDAAGRSNPDFVNPGAGDIGGMTLTPGLYNWSSAVIVPTDT